jgi:hypothetical protein
MASYDFDLFTIGAGSGGVRASRISAGYGARVAVAEERDLGGTCVNVGCIPKKLLVYASLFRRDVEDAAGFGWTAPPPRHDWKTLIQEENAKYFRSGMTAAGFDIKPGIHPIVPVMLYEAPLAQEFARRLLDEGIYVIGFFFPVVPQGEARIRVQLSAAHERHHLDRAIAAFKKVGKDLGVIR